jgi:hypothetical protein
MATEGPRFPGTTANLSNAGTSEDKDAWLNPGNVVSDNATEATIVAATYDSPDISQILVASNFGFAAVSGVVNGITVEIDRRSIIANSGKDFRVQLATGTAFANLVGSNKASATTWPTTSTVATYGGATDTWAAGLTAAQVTAAGFAVFVSCQAGIANADVGIDFIRVTIAYTAAENHDGSLTLTAGGVLGAAGQKGAAGGLSLTGAGLMAAGDSTNRQRGAALAVGGGVLALGETTARALGLSLTASGVLTLTGEAGGGAMEEHSGGIALTGGGVLFSQATTARAGAALLSGGGVLTAIGASSEDENEMGLASTMDALATLSPLDRKYAWPAGSIEAPCVVIGYPELNLDFNFGGSRHASVYPVYVIAGNVVERSARDVLDAAITALPPALTGNLGGAVDSSDCQSAKLVTVAVGGIDYMAAVFNVEVIEA